MLWAFSRLESFLPKESTMSPWCRYLGGSGLPMSTELPNGWSLRYSSAPMYDTDMQHTEFGIDPDVPVNLLNTDREHGIDTIIRIASLLLQGTGS